MMTLIIVFYIVPIAVSVILLYILHNIGIRVMSKYDIYVCFVPILNIVGCLELIELYMNDRN